jgi:hypothetical protein
MLNMKKLHMKSWIIVSVALLFFSGCSSMQTLKLNSVELTNQLRPGMTYAEVESVLGKPKSLQMAGDQMVARWNLQEMWRGYIPYDFIFKAEDQTLISWSENTLTFNQKQEQLKVIADELNKADIANAASGSGGAAPSFDNDQSLMEYFRGMYYSFNSVGGGQTGGTERKVSLCPDGSYFSSSESGYSGDGWGSASSGGGRGTWRITGSKTSGTIVMTDANGKSTTYKYEVCGDGCINFGNTRFAYAGNPECR